MSALRCLACSVTLLALAAGPALSDPQLDRSATTPLGDPVECTADVRDEVVTGPFAVPWTAPEAHARLPRLEGYALIDSLARSLFVPAGEEYAVRFDPASRGLDFR